MTLGVVKPGTGLLALGRLQWKSFLCRFLKVWTLENLIENKTEFPVPSTSLEPAKREIHETGLHKMGREEGEKNLEYFEIFQIFEQEFGKSLEY